MSDLDQGQTMTYGADYIADGGAYDFTIPFQPDRIMVTNFTTGAVDIWYRGMTAAYGVKVDTGAVVAANAFTVADTSGGATAYRATISGITAADPCVVTTSAAHGYITGDIVRLTQLGDAGAVDYGMDELNNFRAKIVVLTTTTFSLQDPVSGEDIDSSAYQAYITGGEVNLETRTASTKFSYAPVTYKVTFGTAVSGADSDVVYFEALKLGQYDSLGDIV